MILPIIVAWVAVLMLTVAVCRAAARRVPATARPGSYANATPAQQFFVNS